MTAGGWCIETSSQCSKYMVCAGAMGTLNRVGKQDESIRGQLNATYPAKTPASNGPIDSSVVIGSM